MSIKNLSITSKVLAILGALGLVTIGASVFSTEMMRLIDRSYGTVIDQQAKAAIYLARANRSLVSVNAAVAQLVVDSTEQGNARALADIKEFRGTFQTFMAVAQAANPATAQKLAGLAQRGLLVIDDTCSSTVALAAKPVASGQAGILASQAEFLNVCGPRFRLLAAELTATVGEAIVNVDRTRAETNRMTSVTIAITDAVVLGGLLIVVGLAVFAVRLWISTPLRALAATMGGLAAGDLERPVAGGDRRDEVGLVARAVQVFKDSGLKLRLNEAAARDVEAAAARERLANEAARIEAAQRQQAVVVALATGLSGLAQGDLTCRLREAFVPEYEQLRTDFIEAATSLENAMGSIASCTEGVRANADEIAQASDDLSRRTEQQAASLEQTAAALDQITATVGTSASGAQEAAKLVAAARGDADSSRIVVDRAVTTMGEIESSSRQIGQIIGVIDEIAFQTNLLALNAGVEAARAGDAGRGFAVVAQEVRALAQRPAGAAREIKTLIQSSSRQVENGVGLVAEAGQALSRIGAQVASIEIQVKGIATSAQEQAAGRRR